MSKEKIWDIWEYRMTVLLIKKTLENTPIEHTLAMELKNSVRELYD